MALQKLPIGIKDFRTIREDGYKYVDKIRYIHQLVTGGKFYLLSRFGKLLIFNALQEMCPGSRDLFKVHFSSEAINIERGKAEEMRF